MGYLVTSFNGEEQNLNKYTAVNYSCIERILGPLWQKYLREEMSQEDFLTIISFYEDRNIVPIGKEEYFLKSRKVANKQLLKFKKLIENGGLLDFERYVLILIFKSNLIVRFDFSKYIMYLKDFATHNKIDKEDFLLSWIDEIKKCQDFEICLYVKSTIDGTLIIPEQISKNCNLSVKNKDEIYKLQEFDNYY